HKNLQFFKEPHKINRRQVRWVTEVLSQFDFNLNHLPGIRNSRVDGLSRSFGGDIKEDNKDVVILQEHMFRVLSELQPEADADLRKRILSTTDYEPAVLKLKDVEKDSEGFLVRHELVYVPPSLQEEIMNIHHDTPLAGHPGRSRTQENITRQYWWPDITSNVKRYVEGCASCRQVNPIHQKGRNTLNPMLIAKMPWEFISVD